MSETHWCIMLCACGVVNNITCSVVTGAFDVQSSIVLQTADPFFVSPTNFTPQRGHDAFVTFVIIAIQPTKGMVLTVKIPLPLFRRIVVYLSISSALFTRHTFAISHYTD